MKKGWTKVAVIYRNDDYGKAGLSHFKDAGAKFGFEVVDAEERVFCHLSEPAAVLPGR